MPASGFCYTLVNYDLNLPTGRWSFLGNLYYRRTVINAHQFFFRLVEMTLWLVQASCSLPEWQAIKQTFFHNLSSCVCTKCKHYARSLNRSQQNLSIFPLLHFNVWPKIFCSIIVYFQEQCYQQIMNMFMKISIDAGSMAYSAPSINDKTEGYR